VSSARHPYRTRPDVEARFVRRELADRDFSLVCRAVLLVLIVAAAVTTIVCAPSGTWAIGATAGAWLLAMSRRSDRRR
jgi:hypothetical protein